MPSTRRPPAEFRQVEPVAGAGQDDNVDIPRLRPGEPFAIGRRRHGVLGADENEGGDAQAGARLVRAGRIERRGGLESEARRGSVRRKSCPEAAIVSAVSAPCEKPTAAIRDGSTAGSRERNVKRAVGVGEPVGKVDGAGLLETAAREIVDKERDIAPARNLAFDCPPVGREAEAGMQEDDRGKGPTSVRPG